ncbi:hypothetical protein [Dysgonomonas sp.]
METFISGFVNLIAVGIGFNAAYSYINRKHKLEGDHGFFDGYIHGIATESIENNTKKTQSEVKDVNDLSGRVDKAIRESGFVSDSDFLKSLKLEIGLAEKKVVETSDEVKSKIDYIIRMKHFEKISIIMTVFGIILLMFAGVESNNRTINLYPFIAEASIIVTIVTLICCFSEYRKESFFIGRRKYMPNIICEFWNGIVKYSCSILYPRRKKWLCFFILVVAIILILEILRYYKCISYPPLFYNSTFKTATLHYSMVLLFLGFLCYLLTIRRIVKRNEKRFKKEIDRIKQELKENEDVFNRFIKITTTPPAISSGFDIKLK